jgi:hypothetical protein
MLKITIKTVLMLIIGTSALCGADAASCLEKRSTVRQEFADAEYVIIAKSVFIKENQSRKFLYRGRRYNILGRLSTVAVEKVYKGRPPSLITFWDEYSSAQFPIDENRRYLIFFRQHGGKDEPYIDTCGNSAELSGLKVGVLNEVRQLSGRIR